MKIGTFKVNYLLIALFSIALIGCSKGKRDGGSSSSLTGWSSKEKEAAGFSSGGSNYKGQDTPAGMVLIEGGAFTMGHVQDDVMFDWNTTPVDLQVRSFFMDEAEVSNSEYLFYLEWLHAVFNPSEDRNKHIYASALPDTLVWRNTLGTNELLTENYLRHPGYADYPVVGVSWVQANGYCKWRTDIVNQKILMDEKLMPNQYGKDSILNGNNRFSTATYLMNPYLLYEGDSAAYTPKDGKMPGVSAGTLTSSFRLPTEAEWEYAAKAYVENREYNNVRGRKKYAWNSKYTRNKNKKSKGDQLANFKQGKGDYSGPAGWSNDGGDISVPIKTYPPNAFGLYDMSGNVSEWVADVYRPIIDSDANDFNYFRGNVFNKPKIDPSGKVVVVDYNSIEYDTLDNGRIVPKQLPGSIKYIPITERDAYMRNNYVKSYNIDANDGDIASGKGFDNNEDITKEKMYNSPIAPKEIGESGLLIQKYDKKLRTSLISDESRVYKGGSWEDREYWLDPAQRRHLPQYMATSSIGFRCATDKIGGMTDSKKKKPTN